MTTAAGKWQRERVAAGCGGYKLLHPSSTNHVAAAPVARHRSDSAGRAKLTGFLSRAIFGALLLLLLLTAIPYGTVDPLWEAVFECSLFILTALWLLEGALRGAWFVSSHRLLVPLLALAGFMFVQTLALPWVTPAAVVVAGVAIRRTLSADPYATELALHKFLALICAAALLLRYTSSTRRVRVLVYTIICIAVASALFGILRQTTGRNPLASLLPRLMGSNGYGQFINRNHFAFLMEMALGLLLGLLAGGGIKRGRVLSHLALALPVATALVLSYSRGGIMALLCQALALCLLVGALLPRSRRLIDREYPASVWRRALRSLAFRALLIACLLAVTVGGVIWVGGTPLVERLESVQGDVESARTGDRLGGSRLQLWRAAWGVIKAAPITGAGFGAYGTAATKYHDASGQMVAREAHNDYLELLASGGLIGAAFSAWFIIRLVKQARSGLHTASAFNRAAGLGALAGLLGPAVHSLFDFGLHISLNAFVAVALVAIAARNGRGATT